MKLKRCFICFMILLFVSAGCSAKKIKSYEAGNLSSKNKVLIAAEDSAFKTGVVSGIISSFKDKDVYFKIIDQKDTQNIKPDDYTFAIVFNTFMAGKSEKEAVSLINKAVKKENVLLIVTLGDTKNWKQDSVKVDSISSASVDSGKSAVITKVIEKLNAVIK
jgi:hypothetical protein